MVDEYYFFLIFRKYDEIVFINDILVIEGD